MPSVSRYVDACTVLRSHTQGGHEAVSLMVAQQVCDDDMAL